MRSFNVNHLANRSFVGDAARAHGTVQSVIDDYDSRKRQKLLNKQADEDRAYARERRSLLDGRQDTAYRQGQDDRTRRLAREDVLQGREDELYAEGKVDRAQQRGMRQEQHEANMYKASEYRNQEGYRRELESLNLEAQRAGLDAAETENATAQWDAERKKEAFQAEKIAKNVMKIEAILKNSDGKVKDAKMADKLLRETAEMAGLNADNLQEDIQSIDQSLDALQGGVSLDDPNFQPALKAYYDSKGVIDGRKGKYAFERMQATEDGFVAMLKSPEGKAGVQTYGKTSDPKDLLKKIDPMDVFEGMMGISQIAQTLQTIKDAHGLNPKSKERQTEKLSDNQRLVDSQTGEVLVDSQAGGSGSSGEPSKQAEILGNYYEDEGDVQGQMAHAALAEKGIVSQQAVEQVKQIAGDSGNVERAAAVVASRTKRQEKLAAGPQPVRQALKETLERHEGLTAEAVDMVKDKEITKILKRFSNSDQISVDQMLSEVAEAARQVERTAKKRKEAKEKRKQEQPSRLRMYREQGQEQQNRLRSLNDRLLAQ